MDKKVRPKKHLGQHFLNDTDIAKKIVDAFLQRQKEPEVLEVGPGTGVLTQYLVKEPCVQLKGIEMDAESVDYLLQTYALKSEDILHGDFLRLDPRAVFEGKPFSIIGNFPYNISSQIFFKVYENHDQIPLVVGMIQKEVAKRIVSGPGGKTGGILSILLQAFYEVEYLFSVPPDVFIPPPKVQSGVIALKRNSRKALPCQEKTFKKIVKQGFNNRRKTLRNALKSLGLPPTLVQHDLLNLRAEQLSVDDFIGLCVLIERESES